MSADFTPTLKPYKHMDNFRMWCQKVLPLVYDDSISYYEILCKLTEQFNVMIQNQSGMYDDITGLTEAFNQLQNYINNYFNNLDVQTEINNKLDEMLQSGALGEEINETLVPAYNGVYNRKIICIGDSYGMRNRPNWCTYFQSALGAITNAKSGSGFTPTNNTFLAQLQEVAESVEDKDSITDIVVAGGWNDAREWTQGRTNASGIQNAILAFLSYANTTFKNALVWVGFLGWQAYYGVQSDEASINYLTLTKEVYTGTVRNKLRVLNSCAYPMRVSWNMDDSYFHPNASGGLKLFYTIAGEMFGSYSYNDNLELVTNFLAEYSQVSNFDSWLSVYNDVQHFVSNAFTVNGTSNKILTFSKQYCPIMPTDNADLVLDRCWFRGTINGENYTGDIYAYIDASDLSLVLLYNGSTSNITSISGLMKIAKTTIGVQSAHSI